MRFHLLVVVMGMSIATGCDDGTLPLSEYNDVDVNVYFYFPDDKEVYLGETRGASSCGDIAYSYATSKNLSRFEKWSYICCTIEKDSDCYRTIRLLTTGNQLYGEGMKRPMSHLIFVIALLTLALSVPASAETIFVKYRDTLIDVDNGHFNRIQLKPSSLVTGMYYDSNNRYLLVRLKQTFYHYCGIPRTVVDDWVKAASLGRYYGSNIKGNYDCRLNPVPEY